MKADKWDGLHTIAARVAALADRVLALLLTLLAVDFVLPRCLPGQRAQGWLVASAEVDDGEQAGDNDAPLRKA